MQFTKFVPGVAVLGVLVSLHGYGYERAYGPSQEEMMSNIDMAFKMGGQMCEDLTLLSKGQVLSKGLVGISCAVSNLARDRTDRGLLSIVENLSAEVEALREEVRALKKQAN